MLKRLKELKERILPLAIPSRDEELELRSATQEFLSLLRSVIEDPRVEVLLCGSAAKGTWIRGKREFDVFVRFPREMASQMHEMLKSFLSAAGLEFREVPASRRYFQVKFRGFQVDVVPVLKISRPEEQEHVTDVSPFHVSYVQGKLSARPELANEVRVLKFFLRTIDCYGAESHVGGLSGYACELLIIAFGSFESTMINLLTRQPPIYVDPERVYGSLEQARRHLSRDKLRSPIILIDPVLPTRNAAASLAWETYHRLIFRTWQSLGYLEPAGPRFPGVRMVVELNSSQPDEAILAQLAALLRELVSRLDRLGFEVLDWQLRELEAGKYALEIRVLRSVLDPYELHIGPPLWSAEAVKRFINKYSRLDSLGYGFKDSRIYVVLPRRIRELKDYVNYLLTSSELSRARVLSKVRRWYLESL